MFYGRVEGKGGEKLVRGLGKCVFFLFFSL